jgi:hypothetical protein
MREKTSRVTRNASQKHVQIVRADQEELPPVTLRSIRWLSCSIAHTGETFVLYVQYLVNVVVKGVVFAQKKPCLTRYAVIIDSLLHLSLSISVHFGERSPEACLVVCGAWVVEIQFRTFPRSHASAREKFELLLSNLWREPIRLCSNWLKICNYEKARIELGTVADKLATPIDVEVARFSLLFFLAYLRICHFLMAFFCKILQN